MGIKQFVLSELPPILCIVIKRFTSFSKIDLVVPFQEEIDLFPYLKRTARESMDHSACKYRLYGCVVHSGGMRGGALHGLYTPLYRQRGERAVVLFE